MNGTIEAILAQRGSTVVAYISVLALATLAVWFGAVASLRADVQSREGSVPRLGETQATQLCTPLRRNRRASLKEDVVLVPIIGLALFVPVTWYLGRVDWIWLREYLDAGLWLFATLAVYKVSSCSKPI